MSVSGMSQGLDGELEQLRRLAGIGTREKTGSGNAQAEHDGIKVLFNIVTESGRAGR